MSPVRRLSLTDHGELDCGIPVPVGLRAGITRAAAGDMRRSRQSADSPRTRFLERHGISRGALYGLHQVHSRRVEIVDEPGAAAMDGREADGLVSARDDVVLSVTVADCLPILLADRESPAFGIVHSGWRGTGIVSEALRLMASRWGCSPRSMAAVIGPGIGACCYTVPPERAAAFTSRYGEAAVVRDGGAPRLDLRAANLVLLEEAGVQDVSVISECTGCTPWLGSFRRQGPERYVLMLAWISRRPAGGPP